MTGRVAHNPGPREAEAPALGAPAVVRLSKPFARAVIADMLVGRTRYTDALRMLGVRNPATLDRMPDELGLTP